MSEAPRYRLVGPFYDETNTLRMEGTELTYEGIPSLVMQPINEAALVKFEAAERALHEGALRKARSSGKEYSGQLPTIDDAINEAFESRRSLAQIPKVVLPSPQAEPLATRRTRGKAVVSDVVSPAQAGEQKLGGNVVTHA